VVCVCCLWNVITVRNDVVELQQRMLLLAHKNNSLSKEKYELEMQIPYLHNNNADIQGKLLDIQTYMKALNEEIKETEDRMMHHKKH
jgi:chromosome segregation ATPase